MIAVIQRVTSAELSIAKKAHATIGQGIVVLLGIENEDNVEDIAWLSKKIINLRIFDDDNDVMNDSLIDSGGEILLVSQFTLHASTKKGNRPSYIKAAKPNISVPIYEKFHKQLEQDLGKPVKTGEFGAMMQIALVNDGPVTIIINTKDKK